MKLKILEVITMLISKIEFVHTIKQIWAICEIMPRKTSALGQLYDTLGVFGVVQGANEASSNRSYDRYGQNSIHIGNPAKVVRG